MKLSRRNLSILLTILLLITLILLNQDIFRFEYHDPLEQNFFPEREAKGYYFLGDAFLLKPGSYEIDLTGKFPERGSEISLIGNDGIILYNEEIDKAEKQLVFDFSYSGKPQNVRIRLNYDPDYGPIMISYIKVSSEHAVYRETIITHLITDITILFLYFFIMLRIWKPEFVFKLIPFLSDRNNEISLWFILFITILVNIPMFQPGKYLNGYDTFFHYSRIRGIAENLKAGIFPPRVELFWLDNIGYGVGLFYPEIFLVIPAFFLLLGFPLYNISGFLWILTTFVALMTHYRTAKKISNGSQIAGISAAVFISLSIYRIQNQYMRDGLGEAFAFIFLPLIIEGLFLVFHKKSDGWKVLAIGFTGTLLSHILSFILAVVFTAVFLLTQIRKIWKDHKYCIEIVKAAAFSIGISAFFLFPLLEQKIAVPDLRINQIIDQTFEGEYSFTIHSVKSLLTLYDPSHITTFYPGWALLLVPVLGIILWKQKGAESHIANVMTAAGIMIMAASTVLFPWKWFRFFLHDIQYTWRLMQSGTVLLSLAGSLYIKILCDNHPPAMILFAQFLVCLAPAIPVIIGLSNAFFQPTEDFYLLDTHIGQGEYLQGNIMRKYVMDNSDRITDINGQTVFTNIKKSGLSINFDFSDHIEEKIDFIVPFIYYKGYAAEIQYENGNKDAATTEAAEDGFVRIRRKGTEHGHMHVWYEGTIIQKVSDCISLLTLIGWVAFKTGTKKGIFKYTLTT